MTLTELKTSIATRLKDKSDEDLERDALELECPLTGRKQAWHADRLLALITLNDLQTLGDLRVLGINLRA